MSTHPELWQSLMRTALLGAGRQKLELPATGGALGSLLESVRILDSEAAILAAAGTLALYDRAGLQPEPSSAPAVPPANEEIKPPCTARAGQHLSLLLTGKFNEILPEWLRAAAAAGQRVPAQHLPALLDLGRRDRSLRPLLLPVLGERGGWLGALNTEWKWAVGVDPEGDWETGSLDGRVALLSEIRKKEAARAREMLVSVWSTEGADTRTAFLHTLSNGLSGEDEPFLEERLDDRSKEVRGTAVSLLIRLPQSRLVGRMRERVLPRIKFVPATRKRLGKDVPAQIELTLPEVCDEGMIRDGVEKKPRPGEGERAWWLQQMISTIPPHFWQDEWGVPAATILRAAANSEWAALLLEAWLQAAERHPDMEWTEALLIAWAHEQAAAGTGKTAAPFHGSAALLVEALPSDRWEILLHSYFEVDSCPLCKGDPLFVTLLTRSRMIGLSTGRLILQAFQSHVTHHNFTTIWIHADQLKHLARTLPPALAREAADGWLVEGTSADTWNRMIEDFNATLQFRYEILEELKPPAPI